MQVQKILKSLIRRWFIVVLGLAVTAGACFYLQQNAPDNYKAQASLVLLPSTKSVGEAGNPYLGLGGMSEALDILTRKMSSEEFKETIREQSGASTFTAEADKGTSGAILLITASSGDADQALKILDSVMNQAPVALTELQDVLNVPTTSRISTMKLLEDSKAVPEVKARTQLLLVTAAGGVAFSIMLTVLIDGLLLSRKHRKSKEPTDKPAGPKPPAPPATRQRKPSSADRLPGNRPTADEPAYLAGETASVVPSSYRPG
ncbi:UNVERIFIED_ORG: capsular polysaccharide biosynthesis protein [Paenarthrobacter nicotinovorans]